MDEMDNFGKFFDCLDKMDLIIPEVMEYEAHRLVEDLREMEDGDAVAVLINGGADYLTRSDTLFIDDFLYRCEIDGVEVVTRMGEALNYKVMTGMDASLKDHIKESKKIHHQGRPDARQS